MAITEIDARSTRCNLCGDRHGRSREGRLGRYSLTCDDCEARRGSHLVHTTVGYASRMTWLSDHDLPPAA